VIGLKAGSFWSSWMITGCIISALTTVLLICLGMLFQFEFFWKTPFLYFFLIILRIIFILFFMFSMSMIMLAFMLSTILDTKQLAYGVSLLFLLVGLVLQIILSNIHMIYFLFYPETMEVWVL